MQKILIAAKNLEIGGIETSLINFINKMKDEYNITLLLEEKEGTLFNKVPKNIDIIEYTPSNQNNIFIRKIKNLIKRSIFLFKYKNKFDCAISFATYSKVCSYTARVASKNSILWGHADYMALYDNNKEEVMKFFKEINYEKFKKIVFVSERGKETFLETFPNIKSKVFVCNNFINYEQIIELSKEKIDIEKENMVTFLNVGRHDEKQKRLTRLIDAAAKLKKDNYKFKILLVGDGPDTKAFKEKVDDIKLNDVLQFVGRKENPYPYFNISDYVILTSEYEGYPVVFLESFVLQKPIITTDISDYSVIQNGYGIVTKKDTNSIYEAMKKAIEEGINIKSFDAHNHNENIKSKLKKIIEEA